MINLKFFIPVSYLYHFILICKVVVVNIKNPIILQNIFLNYIHVRIL